jgi:hypothetical protein
MDAPITMDDINEVLDLITISVFPPRALARQKTYMRKHMRKPKHMTFKAYVERVKELNGYLREFPPYDPDGQPLANDELTSLVENSIPRLWSKHMCLQGFDPIEHTLKDFIEFCERLETAEEFDLTNKGAKPEAEPKAGEKRAAAQMQARKPSDEAPNKKKAKKGKFCPLHKTDRHDISECKVILAQAEKMRAQWETNLPNRYGSGSNNKKPPQKQERKRDVFSTEQVETLMAALKKMTANNMPNKEARKRADDDSDEDENFQLDNKYSSRDDSEEYYPLSELRGRPTPKTKVGQLVPIVIAHVNTRLGKPSIHRIKALLDSGASATIITKEHVKKLRLNKSSSTTWTTKAGDFTTRSTCKIKFSLPEFYENRIVEWTTHVDDSVGPHKYDMIIGRDLLDALGLDMSFRDQTITWDGATVPMKDHEFIHSPLNGTSEKFYWHQDLQESEALQAATNRLKKILDAKYEKADLHEICRACTHLSTAEQDKLLTVLRKHEILFDGTLGRWEGRPCDIELKPGATPYHARPFPIPRVHEQTLKMELERLCQIGVLKKINHSEWAAPTFIVPKKDGTVRFISDLREINKRILRKPYPIPHIQDLLLKLEGFQYATSLDLNMGYYHIILSPFARKICTIVTPFGKYEYQRLPMGLCNSPDIFQERMSDLMTGLEFVRAYIDDILVTTTSDWDDHLDKLDQVLTRLESAGLKINAKKSFFGRSETEYLGFWITRTGISPLPKKVEAITNLDPPKDKKQLRRFIGIVNYYRDMWIRRSDTLAPLNALTCKNTPWQWTAVHQKAFDDMKRIMARETLLAYPNFNLPFDIHTDASHHQLGAVISQNGRPVAFYSRKLNPAQSRYTTTERELLSIVETLKEFRNILLGQQIKIYTDHKNLTHKNFNTERVLRWRLILEEYNPELIYIKRENNVVADALSRLNFTPSSLEANLFSEKNAELFGIADEDFPVPSYPLEYRVIDRYQQRDRALLAKLKQNASGYAVKPFCGGGKQRLLICKHDKIVIPKPLRQRVISWYHETLCHPGINRTEETISQHLWWPKMRDDITNHVSTCPTCQKNKKQRKKYGHLPEKIAETDPWDVLCVDLIGPYTIRRKGHKPLSMKCVTMIDPATGWFEIAQYDDKSSITIANIVEIQWLTRYPLPNQVIFDRGSEFMGHDFKRMMSEDYGIKKKPITVRNPQANAIIERVHQTLGNILRTFELQNFYLDENDPWIGILSATAFAIRSTYHTTLKATPGQLVFGRDMIFNIKHIANWQAIKEQKIRRIKQNNMRENSKRIRHEYQAGDLVLLQKHQPNKLEQPYEGPYKIQQVNTNGTVRLKMGPVTDTVNIRRLQPYKSPDTNRGGECSMRRAKRRRRQ